MEKEIENWEKEFDEICFYEEEASIFEIPPPYPDPMPMMKRVKAEHLGDVQYKLIPEIRKFIRRLLKRERKKWQHDQEILVNSILDAKKQELEDFKKELAEKIEKMYKPQNKETREKIKILGGIVAGWNLAIDEILKLLKNY